MKKNRNTYKEAVNSSVFTLSVDEFCSRDIKNKRYNEKKKPIFPLVLRATTVAIGLGVFFYAISAIGARLIDDYNQDKLYGGLDFFSELTKPTQMREPNKMLSLLEMIEANGVYDHYKTDVLIDEERYNAYHKKYMELKKNYSDVYGWIYINGIDANGTYVDYPIMIDKAEKEGERWYYLYRDYKGNETKNGSIFADPSISLNHEENRNPIIYGHNMGNNRMFRAIKLWYYSAKRDEQAETMTIEIYSGNSLYIYEVFSAYVTTDFNFDKAIFSSDKDFMRYMNGIYNRNGLKNKVEYDEDSIICTLVTCSNSSIDKDSRCVLHGILKKVIEFEN